MVRRSAGRRCRRPRPPCASEVEGRPLVALGGGRVIDAAKAIAGADGLAVRRDPDHALGRRDDAASTACRRASTAGSLVRPSLVIADAGADGLAADAGPRGERDERAGARDRGALHAARQPGRRARRRCARPELIARARAARSPTARALALGALLAGYATGSAGLRRPPRRLPDDRARRAALRTRRPTP